MVCQNCGKNEANVKYTQIVNGVKKEMVLCEECAEKMGISNFKVNMPIHFSNFFDDLFDDEQLLPSFMKENLILSLIFAASSYLSSCIATYNFLFKDSNSST